jgi:hypothetical protein
MSLHGRSPSFKSLRKVELFIQREGQVQLAVLCSRPVHDVNITEEPSIDLTETTAAFWAAVKTFPRKPKNSNVIVDIDTFPSEFQRSCEAM